ncbi:hypothetical protein KDI_40490 [Dictyobacter arantiisoli]|uniref:Protein kinase domain-containing protein n=2 Tax=Dictyobacter arantiisoli TaxID=2014874 RepID=A0A5A5TGX5_9CHLR|nr:hypothetical protein KDI_40490 [Dictyobacter arantiisoli]
MRGDTLRAGRYRLLEEVTLPRNQQWQGSAWLALDSQGTRSRVLLHKLDFLIRIPDKAPRMIEAMRNRMTPLSRHSSATVLLDIFQEKEIYYVVQPYPAGISLALLMQEQGGALPEKDVAEYGRELCGFLTALARQQQPIVHGAISVDTIVISPDHHASLEFLSLFPPLKNSQSESAISSYAAPEQTRGGDIQPSSDLYALAATMHHAVTGFDPRERMVFFYPPARRLNPLVSVGMETILARQLRFSISQRYARPEDMQTDLDALIVSYPSEEMIAASKSASLMQSTGALQVLPQKSKRNTILAISAVSIVLVILLIFLIPFLSNRMVTMQSADATATSVAQASFYHNALDKQLVTELQSYQQKGIGLSDGRLVFDTYTGRVDVSLKKQAATALQSGNMSAAVDFLNQAVNSDPIDGEAQIYNEDLHILQHNSPYVTLALGLPVANSSLYLGNVREQLEAVYLAQHEANTNNLLPGGLKLRIIIANSGSSNSNVATVAQFIANRVSNAGNLDHLIGVIGWYNSTQTVDARDIISSVHLPIIAPTASSVKLSGSSPYFFRISPADDRQGDVLGSLLINNLKAKHILVFRDPTDSYSVSLSNAFAKRVQALGGSMVQQIFSENQTTVAQYQQIITDNANSSTPADAVFMAGFNVDGVRLAHAAGEAARAMPDSASLHNLKVVGGDDFYSVLLLGQGGSADASLALNYPQDMRRLIFTTFADAGEWQQFNIPQSHWPQLFQDWKSIYQGSATGTNAATPTYKGLMIYDAVGVAIHGASLVHDGTITGDRLQSSLLKLGTGSVAAYQGISGQIRFDASTHNPVDKALVILTVGTDANNTNKIVIQQVLGTFRV